MFSSLGSMYSKIQWEERSKLKPLAKWLHAFYSSHAEPEPIHIKKIMQLSGSKTKSFKHFKSNLKSSLKELINIGFLDNSLYIDPEFYLHVTRVKITYKRVS